MPSSSRRAWLPILLLLALLAYCISSHPGVALQALLFPRLRGNGESLSTTFEGTGTGLAFETGIRDVLGRMVVVLAAA